MTLINSLSALFFFWEKSFSPLVTIRWVWLHIDVQLTHTDLSLCKINVLQCSVVNLVAYCITDNFRDIVFVNFMVIRIFMNILPTNYVTTHGKGMTP